MENIINFNQIGKIQTGQYKDWFVKLINDTDGETGGFYVYLIKDLDKYDTVYDTWLEFYDDINEYLTEIECTIIWI